MDIQSVFTFTRRGGYRDPQFFQRALGRSWVWGGHIVLFALDVALAVLVCARFWGMIPWQAVGWIAIMITAQVLILWRCVMEHQQIRSVLKSREQDPSLTELLGSVTAVSQSGLQMALFTCGAGLLAIYFILLVR